MKYCRKCGAEIFDEAVICPHCGVATGNTVPAQNDSGSLWWFVLGFIIPLIGLILYILNFAASHARVRAHKVGVIQGF